MDCYQVAQRYIKTITKELPNNNTNVLTVLEKIDTPTKLSSNSYIVFEQFGDFQVGITIWTNAENNNVEYVTIEVNDNPDTFTRATSINTNINQEPEYTTDWQDQICITWQDGKFTTIY